MFSRNLVLFCVALSQISNYSCSPLVNKGKLLESMFILSVIDVKYEHINHAHSTSYRNISKFSNMRQTSNTQISVIIGPIPKIIIDFHRFVSSDTQPNNISS